MNYIWIFLILISFIFGAVNGKLDDVVNAMLTSSQRAVEVALSLIGVMAFWLGIVRIGQKAGLVEWFSKLISPVVRLIFKDLDKNSPAISDIALNFTANALGLANSATPFGIKAMKDLQNENKGEKDTATNSMCTFLGMNTAGFQLIPTTVLAILIAGGSKNPTEIILPTIIVTTIAFISAILISKLLQGAFK